MVSLHWPRRIFLHVSSDTKKRYAWIHRLNPEIKPLGLSVEEKRDLLSFLGSLNGDKVLIAEPKRLPQ